MCGLDYHHINDKFNSVVVNHSSLLWGGHCGMVARE